MKRLGWVEGLIRDRFTDNACYNGWHRAFGAPMPRLNRLVAGVIFNQRNQYRTTQSAL